MSNLEWHEYLGPAQSNCGESRQTMMRKVQDHTVLESLIDSPILMPDNTFRVVGLDTESISKGKFSMLNFKLGTKVIIKDFGTKRMLKIMPACEEHEVVSKAYFLSAKFDAEQKQE